MALRICFIWLCVLGALSLALAEDAKVTYRLAPQDEISVTVLRHPELSQSYTVPPDGMIDCPRAGRIAVTGKTTTEVAQALKTKYAEFLLDPEVTVMLTKARVRSAFALGAVAKPGQYPLSENMRLTELIAAAGDLVGDQKELTASMKRGQTLMPVDLQGALSGKKPDANLLIQEGDLLLVIAPVRITVTVLGQVKNPGAVRLREGSTPVDALAQAGDVTDRPERMRITLVRGASSERIPWGDATHVLKDGDVIQVEKEMQARIYVNGQVKNPEAYDLPDGGGVMEAIAMAGGVLPTAGLGRVTIIRARDGSKEVVNLSRAFVQGIVENNPKLLSGDLVIVPQITEHIAVWGSVNKAGTFEITEATPITVLDAIGLAGGTGPKAKLNQVMVIRTSGAKPEQIKVDVAAILKKGKNENNIPLKAGDIVYVPEREGLKLGDVLTGLYQMGVVAAVL
ncbi:MAG TPA: SLBB domain-containing protein [Armatimonadota bacterium]|jgi:polysaccharide export outer membrane protein